MWIAVDLIVIAAALAGGVFFAVKWRSGAETPVNGQVLGIPCGLKAAKVSRSQGILTTLAVACESALEFKLRHEWWYDRFGKAIGLCTEFQTRDAAFDQAIYIVCDDPAVHRWLAQDAEARAMLLDLLSLDPVPHTLIESLISTDQGVSIRARTTAPRSAKLDAKTTGDGVARGCIEKLVAIRDRVSAASSAALPSIAPGDSLARHAAFLGGVLGGMVLLGTACLLLPSLEPHGYVPDHALRHAILVTSVPVAVALLAWTFIWLRGSSRRHSMMAAALLAALGVPLLANRLIQDLDQQLDSAPAQFYDARVSGHQYKKLRHGTTYYLSAVRQLDSGNVRLEVDLATYTAVPDGAILRIEEKPGWLHIPWVRSYQPAAAVSVER